MNKRHSINKIVSQKQEGAGNFPLATETFNEAYAELRQAAPNGDLQINLSVEEETDDQPVAASADKHVFRTGALEGGK